uniref:Protein grindelwald n=1 Tax=Anopheles triannulatus TaxID=58253 RepID=A0A2M4AB19_9DIPT
MKVTIVGMFAVMVAFLSIPAAEGCATDCDQHQYCNENNNRCQDCRVLCEKDELSCAHKCPDYLLRSLRQQVDTLQSDLRTYKIVFLVVMSVFVLAIVALLAYKHKSLFDFSRCLPQGKPSSSSSAAGAGPVGYTHENPHTKSPKLAIKNGAIGKQQQVAPSVALSIYPETEAETSVQTGTTSISHRYPAEDSTESYSYDNAACNVTPTSVAPMPKY